MANGKLTEEEKKWRAKDDAHILATAEVIKGDSTRLKMAKTQAKVMAMDEQKRADNLKKIAGLKAAKAQKAKASAVKKVAVKRAPRRTPAKTSRKR